MTAYGPNLAVKCLRDGVESANMQFIWQLDGYAVLPEGAKTSCSYFEAPLCNHLPLRDNVSMALKKTFVGAFDTLNPAPALNHVKCVFENYTSQLLNLEVAGSGQVLYEIHAVRDPAVDGPDAGTLQHIGSLVMDSPFTSSTFGDTELFFRHTFFQEELDV